MERKESVRAQEMRASGGSSQRGEVDLKGAQTRLLSELGSSLVESIMATVIFGLAAVSLLPMLSNIGQSGRQSLIRDQCLKVVRAKLNEYLAGQEIPIATLSPYHQLTPLSADWKGLINDNVQSASKARGFYWAKLQYSRYFPRICASTSNQKTLKDLQETLPAVQADQILDSASFRVNFPSEERYLGVRECVSSEGGLNNLGGRAPLANMEGFVGGSGVNAGCSSAADAEVDRALPGFRLFAKMQLDSSFPVGRAAGSGSTGEAYDGTRPELDNQCPFRISGNLPVYDFDGAGEGIRITVTGVVDFPAPGNQTPSANDRLAGVPRSNRGQFVCSAQSTIRPEPGAVRFYMARDGRVYRARGIDRLKAIQDQLIGSDWLFRSLYTETSGVRGFGGIKSFSVHPRNLSVYVLKAGSLMRYSRCQGFPLDCSLNSGDDGRSDDGQKDVPAVQEFQVDDRYDQVFVDYNRGKVYLLTSARDAIVEVKPLGFANVSEIPDKTPKFGTDYDLSPVWDNVSGASVSAAQAPWMPTVRSGTLSTPLEGWLNKRVKGLTLDPSGNELTVADNTDQSWDAVAYQTTLYRIRDQFLSDPVGYFSDQVHAISQ